MRLPSRIGTSSAIAIALVGAGLFALPAYAEEAAGETELCLDCHADMEGEELSLGEGTSISLYVNEDTWAASVHAVELGCTNCHREISDWPHPDLQVENARAYQLAQAETCNRCHYAYYTRVLDGIHYAQLELGNIDAPTCVDCHGAHATMDPHSPRIEIDRRCGRCHEAISSAYEQSVHGTALSEEGNPDVPVCTDCHGAHAIRDPTLASFHVSEHTICARCHGDVELMARYDLNPAVLETYLDDFHGASNQLYAAGAGTPERPLATCTDCHGVHDIQPFDSSGDANAVRARVVTLCRNCHDEVPEAFADAWLLHYEPTMASAPLVWAVKWVYRILIPLILTGLVLHILLHLWRVRTHNPGGIDHG